MNWGYDFFYGKPLIVPEQRSYMELNKQHVNNLPIWIELHGLELKYQGVKSLTKIVSRIVKFLKVGQGTLNRHRLQFARIVREVEIDQEFPENIQSRNENGLIVEQNVGYG